MMEIDVKASRHQDDQVERLEKYNSKLKKILEDKPPAIHKDIYNIAISLRSIVRLQIKINYCYTYKFNIYFFISNNIYS